jgi:hypothetical protein
MVGDEGAFLAETPQTCDSASFARVPPTPTAPQLPDVREKTPKAPQGTLDVAGLCMCARQPHRLVALMARLSPHSREQ